MIGTNDFIEYWSAYQLFLGDKNPYDPVLMLEIQRSLKDSVTTPLMMWNPPWLLFFMAPILSFSFGTAASLWFAMNLLFATGAILFTLQALGAESKLALDYCKRLFLLSPLEHASTWTGKPILYFCRCWALLRLSAKTRYICRFLSEPGLQ